MPAAYGTIWQPRAQWQQTEHYKAAGGQWGMRLKAGRVNGPQEGVTQVHFQAY